MTRTVGYLKNGIKIQSNPSKFPAPRPQGAWPTPAFQDAESSHLSLSLVAIPQAYISGIRVVSTGPLPGGNDCTWVLYDAPWAMVQGGVLIPGGTAPSGGGGIAGTGDGSSASDVVVDKHVRTPVATVDTFNTTLPTSYPGINGRTIALGDRVLFTALASGNNEIWVATGNLSAIIWVLSKDGYNSDGTPAEGDNVLVLYGSYAGAVCTFTDGNWVPPYEAPVEPENPPLDVRVITARFDAEGIDNMYIIDSSNGNVPAKLSSDGGSVTDIEKWAYSPSARVATSGTTVFALYQRNDIDDIFISSWPLGDFTGIPYYATWNAWANGTRITFRQNTEYGVTVTASAGSTYAWSASISNADANGWSVTGSAGDFTPNIFIISDIVIGGSDALTITCVVTFPDNTTATLTGSYPYKGM